CAPAFGAFDRGRLKSIEHAREELRPALTLDGDVDESRAIRRDRKWGESATLDALTGGNRDRQAHQRSLGRCGRAVREPESARDQETADGKGGDGQCARE